MLAIGCLFVSASKVNPEADDALVEGGRHQSQNHDPDHVTALIYIAFNAVGVSA